MLFFTKKKNNSITTSSGWDPDDISRATRPQVHVPNSRPSRLLVSAGSLIVLKVCAQLLPGG